MTAEATTKGPAISWIDIAITVAISVAVVVVMVQPQARRGFRPNNNQGER